MTTHTPIVLIAGNFTINPVGLAKDVGAWLIGATGDVMTFRLWSTLKLAGFVGKFTTASRPIGTLWKGGFDLVDCEACDCDFNRHAFASNVCGAFNPRINSKHKCETFRKKGSKGFLDRGL